MLIFASPRLIFWEINTRKLRDIAGTLSEAGIGILLATELNVGDVVDFNFLLPGIRHCLGKCERVVRYRRGYHYGFEFLSLTRDQQAIAE